MLLLEKREYEVPLSLNYIFMGHYHKSYKNFSQQRGMEPYQTRHRNDRAVLFIHMCILCHLANCALVIVTCVDRQED